MRHVVTLYRSSVGKKVIMAVTGVVWVGYVIAHMMGNLKAFQGAERIDAYGEFLREVGVPLFGHGEVLLLARVVLIISIGLHVLCAWQLTRMSQVARPVSYRQAPHLELSYASRTMRWGGVMIALFVIFHLMHFTIGNIHPDFVPGGVYHNLVAGFQSWPIAIVYIVAVGALGFHLYHGVWSTFQTLGANHPTYNRYRRWVAAVIAVAVFAGFASVPAAVLAGILR
ncbi:MAG TPA: succinate dehydrogenase cytochrome b subunit [Gemmatimonadales bacterium]